MTWIDTYSDYLSLYYHFEFYNENSLNMDKDSNQFIAFQCVSIWNLRILLGYIPFFSLYPLR